MPSILEIDGYRLCVYFFDHMPPHAHVLKNEGEALVSLLDLSVLRESRMKAQELKRAVELVEQNLQQLKEEWNASNPKSKI